jgi:hypothetical protein
MAGGGTLGIRVSAEVGEIGGEEERGRESDIE